MPIPDVAIVGGGIAGLATAYALVRAGAGRVQLLEREPMPCAHSSGRNAAIFRHLSTGAGDLELALRSKELLDGLLGQRTAWLNTTGAWFIAASPEPLQPLAQVAASAGLSPRALSGQALTRELPQLEGGGVRHALYCAQDGVIDIHAVTEALRAAIAAAGGLVSLNCEVTGIHAEQGRVRAVQASSGERISAGAVVIAAGAWAKSLGECCEAPLPLIARRRHLTLLETGERVDPGGPVLWALGDEVYLRPDSGGLLASPCDEEDWPPCLPPPSDSALELLARKLGWVAPALAEASVRRSWACLRTFAPDRAPAIGADPRLEGLYWLAGLGGHGMTAGVAAGELLAKLITGEAPPLSSALSPARLLAR